MNLLQCYKNRRVLVTGHTGFKGSWLVLWLNRLGAHVTGWSIDVPTKPSMFEVTRIADLCDHHFGDINDRDALTKFVSAGHFDTVFHLAAQPLVRLSYKDPLSTLATNVIGTANVLEAVRAAARACAVVAVTSDKCYENTGSVWGFRENDPMGGADPYSMSKGAAELLIASWRRSYFSGRESPIKLASARAGNVIGGGDWAVDRIITDSIAALQANRPIPVRNPHAVRPWQHVLEPLSGYLALGALLGTDLRWESSWNFGPAVRDVRPVRDLAECLISNWGSGTWEATGNATELEEATTLSLNCDKACRLLGWVPVWPFERAIAETARWFRAMEDGASMRDLSCTQISAYEKDASVLGAAWTQGSAEVA